MRKALVIALSLILLSSSGQDDTCHARELSAARAKSPIFDPKLSKVLQQALEQAARDQGADSVSASLYISDRCYWEGATGVTKQDPSIPVTPDTLYAFGSITKTFVAAIVLQLVEENKLKLNDKLGKWLDDYRNIDPNVTVRQLLNHSSGLNGYMGSRRFRSDVRANPDRILSPEDILKYVRRPIAPPGDGRLYTNTNYILLGLIIEAVTGNPVERELENRITGPLDLNRTSLRKSNFTPRRWSNSTAPSSAMYSAIWTAGALASTSRDVAKWAQALFAGNVIQAKTLKRMLVFEDRKISRTSIPMGLGVWNLSSRGIVAWGHGGRVRPFLARMAYLPELRLGIAYSSSGGRNQGIPGKFLVRAYIANRPDNISSCFDDPN